MAYNEELIKETAADKFCALNVHNVGAPKFPLSGWRTPLGLASPHHSYSSTFLLTSFCCRFLHLQLLFNTLMKTL